MKLFRKSKKVIVSMALTAALVLSGSTAASAAWGSADNPTTVAPIDSSIITVAAHRDANVLAEILGANLVATNQIGGASPYTLNDIQGEDVPIVTAQENPLLKIFGSSLNDNFDPYLNNFLYNSVAGDTVGTEAVNTAYGAPNEADVITRYLLGQYIVTSESLDQRPDILLGIDATSSGATYQALIARIPDYNPQLVDYNLTTSYDILDDLKDLAAAIQTVKTITGKTTRYGDPVTIAADYEKYIIGLQAYVVKQINTGAVDKKTVAIVNPTPNKNGTYKAYDVTVSEGTAAVCRAAEYVANTTYNITAGMIKNADGTYHVTAAQVKAADVIIIAGITNIGNDGSATEALFKDSLGGTDKPILSSLPITAYGMFMNSADNAIGFGYYNGFIYGNDVLNPTYTTAYFFEKFYHITNSAKLQTAIVESLSTVAGDGVGSSLSSYSTAGIQSKIMEGWNYYQGGGEPGDTIYCSNEPLTQAQMEVNARYIYNYLIARGWTKNAICGMLGNMQTESWINPGKWEVTNDLGYGFGLTQWTPASKYFDWAAANGLAAYDIDSQLKRILYEVEHDGEQWINPNQDMTFEEFTHSNDTAYNLAMAFLKYYERARNIDQPNRGTQAEAWYEFFD